MSKNADFSRLKDAVNSISEKIPEGFSPKVGIVLGSGLGDVAEHFEGVVDIAYREIPGFVEPGVSSHAGTLRLGRMAGVDVALLQGRVHAYEGHDMADVVRPVRTLALLGCELVILTNAAGSLLEDVCPGRLMMITDHINWAGLNPLTGLNEERLGPRFIDMSEAYDRKARVSFRVAAESAGVDLAEGVYCWFPGPSFETPAEIRAARVLGADAVGMSTVPECIALRHMGVKVLAVSGITNLAAGMVEGSALDHAETMTQGAAMAEDLAKVLTAFLGSYASEAGEV